MERVKTLSQRAGRLKATCSAYLSRRLTPCSSSIHRSMQISSSCIPSAITTSNHWTCCHPLLQPPRTITMNWTLCQTSLLLRKRCFLWSISSKIKTMRRIKPSINHTAWIMKNREQPMFYKCCLSTRTSISRCQEKCLRISNSSIWKTVCIRMLRPICMQPTKMLPSSWALSATWITM